ncbi:hypothetical protein ACGFIY_18735 [Micromonospora chersina]|uniref:hypothetical protein n=1 Tax=Micromonospora chersina TaxID=47854 RepID=UPI0037101487
MLSYVRWYWPEEDRWNYDELDTDRWSLRHVELGGIERSWRRCLWQKRWQHATQEAGALL